MSSPPNSMPPINELKEVKVHPNKASTRRERGGGFTRISTDGSSDFSSPFARINVARAPSSKLISMGSVGDLHVPNVTEVKPIVSPFSLDPLHEATEYLGPEGSRKGSMEKGVVQWQSPFSEGTPFTRSGLATTHEVDDEDEDEDIGRVLKEYMEEEKAEEEQRRQAEEDKHARLVRGNGFVPCLAWTRIFTKGFLFLAWTLVFLFTGITMKLEEDVREWLYLPVWKVCILLGCLPTIRYVPSHIMFVLIFLLENQLVSKNGGVLVYYLMSIRRHAVSLMRCLLGLVIFHFFVAVDVKEDFQAWELAIAKIWSCIALMYFGNVLKALIARSLSRHFHSKAYFERMQEAVQNEYYLMALLKPRGTQLLPALLGTQHLGQISNVFMGPRRDRYVHDQHAAAAQKIDTPGVMLRSASDTDLGRSSTSGLHIGLDARISTDRRTSRLLSRQLSTNSNESTLAQMRKPSSPGMRRQRVSTSGSDAGIRSRAGSMLPSVMMRGGSLTQGVSISPGISMTPGMPMAAGSTPMAAGMPLAPLAPMSPYGMRRVEDIDNSPSWSQGGAPSQVYASTAAAAAAAAGGDSKFGADRKYSAMVLNSGSSPPKGVQMENFGPTSEDAPLLPKLEPRSTARPGHLSAHTSNISPPSPSIKKGSLEGAGRYRRSVEEAGKPTPTSMKDAVQLSLSRTVEFFKKLNRNYKDTVLMSRYAKNSNDVVTVVGPDGAKLAYASDVAAAEVAERQAARRAGSLPNADTIGPMGAGTALAAKMPAKNREMSLYWLEKHIRNNKLKYVTLTDQLVQAAESPDLSSEISSKVEAKRLAFSIYWNVLGSNMERSFMLPTDLHIFFETHEEAQACFDIFDSDGNGKVYLSEVVEVIIKVYKERKKLALSLKDTKSVVAKLELVCGVIIQTMFVLAYLYIFNINIGSLWVSISTFCLAFVFVFGNSLRTLYESVLFLFIIHPFDVGDWLQLSGGEVCKVEGIDLMAITALKSNGRRLYIPINRLMSDIIMNYSRSEHMWDTCVMLVDLDTPVWVLKHVEKRMKEHAAKNPKEYCTNDDSVAVIARSLEDPKKLKWLAYWELTHVAEDVGRTFEWRSKMVMVAQDALNEAGVTFTQPPEAPYELKQGMRPYELPENEMVDLATNQYMFARTGVLLTQQGNKMRAERPFERSVSHRRASGAADSTTGSGGNSPLVRMHGLTS